MYDCVKTAVMGGFPPGRDKKHTFKNTERRLNNKNNDNFFQVNWNILQFQYQFVLVTHIKK